MPTFNRTTILGEGPILTDWLKGELQEVPGYTRVAGVVIAGADLATGTVLGKITASGKYTQLAPAGSDGSQTAAGILILDVEGGSSVEEEAAVIVRGPVVVIESKLTWPTGISGGQQATAVTQLQALGIQFGEAA